MESETSCRSTVVSEDEVGRCLSEDSDRGDDDCCCSCSNCPPHIFTSILLGLLACVLVSGGVFLAFHKWDHTWLLVSAVGVILMIIGTALHCCSASKNDRKKHRCKGGCGNGSGRNSKPDPLGNGGGGGMLAEQLLPLSNARSVSQLSLNMVPGYFPPIVYPTTGAPYGLEQHSAVVQNISRLVQHQQQLHLQQAPSTTAAASANGDGARSFILLSLPADANPANIQNIVNAVCQLDANSSNQSEIANQTSQEAETTISVPLQSSSTSPHHPEANGVVLLSTPLATGDTNAASASSSPNTTPPISSVTTTTAPSCSSQPPALKNVEVQTCSNWPIPLASDLKAPASSRSCASQSDAGGSRSMTVAAENVSHDINGRADSTDENSQRTSSSEVCLIDIGDSTTQSTSSAQTETGNMICDTEQLSVVQINIPSTVMSDHQDIDLMDMTSDPPALIELPSSASVNTTMHSICNGSSVTAEDGVNEDIGCSIQNNNVDSAPGQETNDPEQQAGSSADPPPCGAAVQSSNLEDTPESSSDFDEEDSDLMDRSSPPPSYEDVTQEGQTPALGAIGLAYGTL